MAKAGIVLWESELHIKNGLLRKKYYLCPPSPSRRPLHAIRVMMDYELKNIDSEDIDDLLLKVESSFNIEFIDNELSHITTFGEFCDYIAEKIQLENTDDCTSQQAFYKFRKAISESLQINRKFIYPNSQLVDFLPKRHRRARIKKIEKHLGFELKILRPKNWIVIFLLIVSLSSFVGLFVYWKIGIVGLLFSIMGIKFSYKIGIEMDLKTVREVVKKMTRENYFESRRNPNTFSKKEIEQVLKDLFCSELCLDESKLTRDVVRKSNHSVHQVLHYVH